jgi:hypothetical protein
MEESMMCRPPSRISRRPGNLRDVMEELIEEGGLRMRWTLAMIAYWTIDSL